MTIDTGGYRVSSTLEGAEEFSDTFSISAVRELRDISTRVGFVSVGVDMPLFKAVIVSGCWKRMISYMSGWGEKTGAQSNNYEREYKVFIDCNEPLGS